MKCSSYSTFPLTICFHLWISPRTSQLAVNKRTNRTRDSDLSKISSLVSNHPLPAHLLPHLNFRLSKRSDKGFHCGVTPDGSLSLLPDLPSEHWKTLLLGILISALLPFLNSKLSSLLKLKNEVETAIETVDKVVETAEKVAEEVEKVAEIVAEQTPAGSKLHAAATSVENVAKEVARDAHLADNVLDKVEEIEKKLESLVEPMIMVDEVNKSADRQEN